MENNNNLIESVENNNFEQVLHLIRDKDADIEFLNSKNETPLITACKYGYNQIALLLVSLRVNINVEDDLGFTPLIYACANNMIDVVENILGYPFKDFNQRKKLIEHKNIYGNNALLTACYSACREIVMALIKYGANVNCKNKKKDTPLIAILTFNSQNRASIIRLLLRQGALTNVTNLENKSLVELAWKSKNFAEITKILIFEGGAIPPAKLMLEQFNQDEDLFKFIRKIKLEKI
jgi:ankyrin repeat protein